MGATRLLRTNCAPVASTMGGELFFNERQPNGRWDARVGMIDNPSDSVPFLPAHDGHRGAADCTPDGRLVLLEVDLGSPRGADWAEPGKGAGMQLFLLDRGTGSQRQLTTGRKGIIWSKLHPSGGKVCWAEMVKAPLEAGSLFPWDPYFLGQWELHVADIASGGLVNERSWRHATDPGFLETYGWLGDRIMFASDQGVRQPSSWWEWLQAQLWTVPDDLSAPPVRVSPPFKVPTWCSGQPWCSVWFTEESPYHEFMHYVDGWLYFGVVWERDLPGAGGDPPYNGLDLWRMRPGAEAATRERVTSFNATAYKNVGGLAPDRTRPGRLVLGVAGDANAKTIDAYEVIP